MKHSDYFIYIWEYLVKDTSSEAFKKAYEPAGTWGQLFSRAEGYISTELFIDDAKSNRYITIDYWESKLSRDNFLKQFGAEFKALDKACESYTLVERFIGDFHVIEGKPLGLTPGLSPLRVD